MTHGVYETRGTITIYSLLDPETMLSHERTYLPIYDSALLAVCIVSVCHIFVITGYKHTQIMKPFIVRRRHFRRIPHIPGLQDALQDLSQGPGLRTQDSWRLL